MLTLKNISIMCGLLVCLTTQAGCSGCTEPTAIDHDGGGAGGGGGSSTISLIKVDAAGQGGAGQCIDEQCDCVMCCVDGEVCTEAACCQSCCR